MPDDQRTGPHYPSVRLREFLPILNSMFQTAKVGVTVIDLVLLKEEVVIGFPQVEFYDNELRQVDSMAEIEPSARYLMLTWLNTRGREVAVHARFYITSERRFHMEEHGDDGVILVDATEADSPEKLEAIQETATYGASWALVIVRLILSYAGYSVIDAEPGSVGKG